MDLFLYDRDLRHERVKGFFSKSDLMESSDEFVVILNGKLHFFAVLVKFFMFQILPSLD